MNSAGVVTTLYSFGGGVEGDTPYSGLVQYADGDFYGTTSGAMSCTGGCGTVYKINRKGEQTTLYKFGEGSGIIWAGVIVGANSNFYGITGDGFIFELTPMGLFTPLAFTGGNSYGGLLLATDGNFYGTSGNTLFRMSPGGTLSSLHIFCTQQGCPDGDMPSGGVFQATNGTLYGTTYDGGMYRCGTVFSFAMGLGPFVAPVRLAGRAGQTGGILGSGFTETSSVVLNGTPATFTVVSDTFLKAAVPPGATTGYVTVTTPSGTLTSNVPFHVIQ